MTTAQKLSNQAVFDELAPRIARVPTPDKYRNSAVIATVRGQSLQVEDVIKACLISRSNLFLAGGRGEGKTDAVSDFFFRAFGGRGVFLEMEPDLSVKELYARLNLGKLYNKQALTDADIHELTETLNTHVIVVDEITRGPPIVQNQLLSLANGVFRHRGKEHRIGDGYAVMLATGNVGKEHSGTFELGDALLDRLNVIIDLNHFEISPSDFSHILAGDHDPRVHVYEAEQKIKWDDEFIAMSKVISELQPTSNMLLMAQYLRFGLNWCSKMKMEKKKIKSGIPSIVCKGCEDLAGGCGFVKAPSTRAMKNIMRLTLALQAVAESKNLAQAQDDEREVTPTMKNDVADVLQVFRIVAPPLGIFDPRFVEQNHKGNPILFANEVIGRIQARFKDKETVLTRAFAELKHGALHPDVISALDKEWTPIAEWLSTLAAATRK